MKYLLLFVCILTVQGQLIGQGIRGKITDIDGESLPFASVVIRNLGDGVPSNNLGEYAYPLNPGHYDVVFQYMGYASKVVPVEISDEWLQLDVQLEAQVYTLKEITVTSGKEDPAATIMRKAIAKAKYHRLQLDEYSMTVYIKGTGKLTNAPFFMKKKLKEEGLNLNEAYTSESVSRITVSQPNKVEEKVINIRTNGENNATSPAPYIGASFYDDKINQAISPLSKAAFAYYSFTYMGYFMEEGVLINKIKVTPRSKGEFVFDGDLFIVEDSWAIHSLNLNNSLMGFKINVNQLYTQIEPEVWLPTTHTYIFGGKFFGFSGDYTYLASCRDFEIKRNADLIIKPTIIDEKVEDAPPPIAQIRQENPQTQLANTEEMSRKDFRKLINAYEKESLKEQKNTEIITERLYSVDSLAKKRELNYWDSIRPMPLTNLEIQGYQRDDSLAVIEQAKASDEDSLKSKVKKKFNPIDILNGGQYHFGKGRSIRIHPAFSRYNFNTVEGFNAGTALSFRWNRKEKLADSVTTLHKNATLKPEFRYGFSSRKAYYRLGFDKEIKINSNINHFGIQGGTFIYQFNDDNPITEFVNSAYSLVMRQNFMKLYEKDFVHLWYLKQFNEGLTFKFGAEYAQRRLLENNSEYSLRDASKVEYTSNVPINLEMEAAEFTQTNAALLDVEMRWRPGLKYGKYNDRQFAINSSAPLLRVKYKKGLSGVVDSEVDFDHLELGVEHGHRFGVSGKLDYNLTAGSFLNNTNMGFMDFKHFGGNQTIFSNMGAVSNYRFMDYYLYSTQANYVSAITHYQFRKFLLTKLPELRFSGVRENIFFNYLKTEKSPHYMELGYSLDNLFRIFRLEFGAAFENGRYSHFGVRIGIATFLSVSMDD